ncbi:MAG: hypothetical protein QXF15_01510 [Candidatus Aenigmatarchaeota archaeon]|nr:hypothetical protein [Candidatus Aenigmarchaeota archaeon]
MPFIKKTAHFNDSKISELPKNGRVRLLGTIVNLNKSSFFLDDGTGIVEVLFDSEDKLSYINSGQRVKVIADVIGEKCFGCCVQEINNFDIELNRKIRENTIKF